MTFQGDAHELIKSKIKIINEHMDKIELSDFDYLNIQESEMLINLIKQLDYQGQLLIDVINNIKNIKNNYVKNQLIEKELNKKITPISIVYRTLLHEKYKNHTIDELRHLNNDINSLD